ncbi:MAG: alpha/beta fold hydrolase, partial [Myxococcota bacterium]
RRIGEHIQEHPEHAKDLELDAGALMMKWHRLTDTFEIAPDLEEIGEPEPFDMRGHAETWEDMLRCRRLGIHPQSFVSIKVPTLMLHGEHDPHPGPMIRESLRRYIPQLEYRELERCGHEPEIERHARDEFFSLMNAWLAEVFGNEAEA